MTPDLEVGVGTRVNRVKGVVFGARAKSMEADVAEAEGAESASSISNAAGALDLGRPLSVPARYLPASHLPDSFIEGCKRARKVPVVAVLDGKAAARPILRAALTVETKHVTQLPCACLVTLASCEPLPVPAAKSANTNTRSGHETAGELAGRWKDRLETEADSPVLGCDQKELVPGTITKDHRGHSSPAPFARWRVCLSSKRWPKHTGHPGSDLSFLLLPNRIEIPLFPVPTAIAGCLGGGGGGGRLVSSCRS